MQIRNFDCKDSKPLICRQLATHAFQGLTTRSTHIYILSHTSQFHFLFSSALNKSDAHMFIHCPTSHPCDISSRPGSNKINMLEVGLQHQGVNLLFHHLLALLLKFSSIKKKYIYIYILVIHWIRFHYSHLHGRQFITLSWIPKLSKYYRIQFFLCDIKG